jgi:hypothetical protein
MLASFVLLAGGQGVASAHPGHHGPDHHGHEPGWRNRTPVVPVDVTTDGGYRMPSTLHAGFVTFRFTSPENAFHALQGFSLKGGATLDQAMDDINKALSGVTAQTIEGMQGLYRDVVEVGGAVTNPYGAQEVTIPLTAGTYYFLDLNEVDSPPLTPHIHTVHVVGRFQLSPLPHYSAVIESTMSDDDMPVFKAPATLPHNGTFLARVTGDELHETVFRPVKPGITDDYISTYYTAILNGTTPAPASPWTGIQAGLQSLSPGRWAITHINLAPGPYALICYVPGDEDGIPHAYMGMHNIMTLT